MNKLLATMLEAMDQRVQQAQSKGICINCGENAHSKIYTPAGAREYQQSGLCEVCFDDITDIEKE